MNNESSDSSSAGASITRREFLSAVLVAGAGSVVLGCGSGTPAAASRPPLDLVIKGGHVLDGTGAEEKLVDVGIRDGRIVALGGLQEAKAARIIDATGLKVVPGFIDIHSHVDLDLVRNPGAESKIRQGVTTEVTGADGMSVAPLGGPSLDRTLKAFRDDYGFDCPYRDMDGFFRFTEQRRHAPNLISMIGLGTIREVVVGETNRPARADEMDQMKREVVRAVEQGCWGVSTGLEYTPGSFASTEELTALVRVVPEEYRIYATHMRNEDNRLLEAIEEAVTIARGANASLQVSHLKASYKINWQKQERAIAMLQEASDKGMSVHADRYTYIAYNTDLVALFPLWSRDGGTEGLLVRLKDPTNLMRIRGDVQRKIDGLGSWDAILISSVKREDDRRYQGKTVQQIAAEEHVDPFEFAVALMEREDGDVSIVGFGMDEAGTEMVLRWKNTMIASDAGASSPSASTSRPHPRAYGTFPRAIAYYQRERKITTLPDMIRKMTSLPAQKLGLADRGTIGPGQAADIVLFDYTRINDRATFLDPHRFPDGVPFVIVNGEVVVDNNVQTTALPGKVLRSRT
jgi:N-acyl-D-amino-acid deacylase